MSDEPARPDDEPAGTPPAGDAPQEGAPQEGVPQEGRGEQAAPACAECGAALADDQTYCLECGAPTPRAPKLTRGGRAGLVIAGALVILGLGAGALAYAVMEDDDGGAPATVASTVVETAAFPTTDEFTIPTDMGTGPLPPDTSGLPTDPFPTDTTGFPTDRIPTDTVPDTDTGGDFPVITEQPSTEEEPDPEPDPLTEEDPDPPPDPGADETDWPVGESAWTAIVSSTTSESEARATADRLAATGEDAGVLRSSDHPGLRPGYWVVFSGSFSSRSAAAAHARALAGRFPGAYPRYVQG